MSSRGHSQLPLQTRMACCGLCSSRAASLVTAFLALLAAGSLYAVSVYAPDLHNHVTTAGPLTTEELETIGTWGQVGTFVNPHGGLLGDRIGARGTLAVAGALTVGGYATVLVMIAAAAPAGALSAAYFVIGQGASLTFMAAVKNERNYPESRGTSVGFIVAGFGMSAALVSGVYQAWFHASRAVGGFLVWMVIFCVVVYGLALAYCDIPDMVAHGPALLDDDGEWAHGANGSDGDRRGGGGGAAALLGAAGADANAEGGDGVAAANFTLKIGGAGDGDGDGDGDEIASASASAAGKWPEPGARAESLELERLPSRSSGARSTSAAAAMVAGELEVHPSQLWRHYSFWAMFVGNACFLGAVIMWVVQVGYIQQTLWPAGADVASQVSRSALVSTFAACNVCARLLTGLSSDLAMHAVPRVAWFIVGGLLMGVTYAVMLFVDGNMVILGSVGCGVTEGILFASWPVLARELWGRANASGNFALLNMAIGVGTFVFNHVANALYAAGAKASGGGGGDTDVCEGRGCFDTAFKVCIVACVVALLMLVPLWLDQWRKHAPIRAARRLELQRARAA